MFSLGESVTGEDAPHLVVLLNGPTTAESRVLELAAAGLSTVEIAGELWVTPAAVTFHLGNLFRKLGAANRAGMVARSYAVGLLQPGTWPPAVDRGLTAPLRRSTA